VSGHRPRDEESKRQPYALAAPGAVGLETLLQVALRLYHQKQARLPRIFELLSRNPARLLGIEGGSLDAGERADLVLFDPDTPWLVDRYELHSKCKNTPFDGACLLGRVLRTVIAGRTVFEASK